MSATYLFNQEGLAALARYVTPSTLFAFDLDGTLAPIIENYSAVQVTEPVKATLARLIKLANVTVITGRSRKDALSILACEPQLLVGNHGAEWPEQTGVQVRNEETHCIEWLEQLHSMLHGEQGVEIEYKGASLSLHYRKAHDVHKALSRINEAIKTLVPTPRKIGGKFVINLLRMEDLTKGDALVAAMERFNVKRAIFIGDDETDEEIFKLQHVDVFGIHIGQDGQTAAPYYLKKQSALLGLLNSMVGILESSKQP